MCMLEAGSKQVMNLSSFLAEGGRREASSRWEVMEGLVSLRPVQEEELSFKRKNNHKGCISSQLFPKLLKSTLKCEEGNSQQGNEQGRI